MAAERRTTLYLVMPFYRGVRLAQRLEASPPATLADLAQKQVVHGDIKLLDLGFAALSGLDEAEGAGSAARRDTWRRSLRGTDIVVEICSPTSKIPKERVCVVDCLVHPPLGRLLPPRGRSGSAATLAAGRGGSS